MNTAHRKNRRRNGRVQPAENADETLTIVECARKDLGESPQRRGANPGAATESGDTTNPAPREFDRADLIRRRRTRTTIPGKDGKRAGDLLNRDFTAPHPNHSWVTDFTYVPTWAGFVYFAYAIDHYSGAIVSWQASTVEDTAFVEACLRMKLRRRDHTGRPVLLGMIHHSDAATTG